MRRINIHTKNRHFYLATAYLVILMLPVFLGGCSSLNNQNMGTTQLNNSESVIIENQENSGGDTAQQDSASSGTEDDAINKNTIIAGTDATFPPFSFSDEGVISGFDIDIIYEIAQRLGKEVEFQPSKWDLDFKDLIEGNLDFVISAIPYKDVFEKDSIIDFSNPYFNMKFLLIVLADSEVKLKEGLVGSNVGMLESSMDCLEKEYTKDFNISYFKDVIEMLDTLKNKEIDAVILNLPIAINLIGENKDMYIVIEETASLKDFVIVFENESSLKPEFDRVLEEIKSDGTYEEIYFKWFAY